MLFRSKRAKCEDPVTIKEWFSLVQNIVAKLRAASETAQQVVLRVGNGAVVYVVIWGIMPVRVRGTRNQLQLNTGHYKGQGCNSSR